MWVGVLSKVSTLIYGDVRIDYEYLFLNGYATYDHMLVIYNLTLSTHLIVDTGCQFYWHMSYISIFDYLSKMYACLCV